MKRISLLVLCLILVVLLTGCTSEEEKELFANAARAWESVGRPTTVSTVIHCWFNNDGLANMEKAARETAEVFGISEYFEDESEYSIFYGFDTEQRIDAGDLFCFICDQGNIYVLMDSTGGIVATADQYEMSELASEYSNLFPPEVYSLQNEEDRRALLRSNLDKAKVLNKRIAILSGASIGCANAPVSSKAEVNEWHMLPDQWVQKLLAGNDSL